MKVMDRNRQVSAPSRTTGRSAEWLAALQADRVALALTVLGLLALTLIDALTPLVMVSTLGILVVIFGLFGQPRSVVMVGVLAISLALGLVLGVHASVMSPLRVINVVIGSAIAFASAVARHHRLRDLQRMRRRDAALLRSIGDAILGVDLHGQATFSNIAAQRMLGLEARDVADGESGPPVQHPAEAESGRA
jgi:PAS domain-containing protein